MRRSTRRGSNGLANTIYWVTASLGGEAVLSKSWLAQNFIIFKGLFFNYITQCENFDPFFSLKLDSLILKTHFISL